MVSVEVGTELPSVERSMSQEMIDAWAVVSGDTNPLHVDPEYAKTTQFGGTIAHGHIALGFLCEMMIQWSGSDWYRTGALRGVKFVKPIRPGHDVRTLGTVVNVREHDGRLVAECDVSVVNAETGVTCVVGAATVGLSAS